MKKGFMTAEMIAVLVLALAGFLIVILMYSQLNWSGEVDREICHDSAVLRATSEEVVGSTETIPLKCKTEKICVSDNLIGKGDCQEELGEEYNSVKITSNKDKKQEQLNKALAVEMADCWSMIGEGKIRVFKELVGPELIGMDSRKCVVCSRISFDGSSVEGMKEINGLSEYLLTRQIGVTEKTYWEYLNGVKSVEEIQAYGIDITQLSSLSLNQKAVVYVESGDYGSKIALVDYKPESFEELKCSSIESTP